jgi:hypothetical protein
MGKFTAINPHGPGPPETARQITDRSQNTYMQEGIEMEPVFGPDPAITQKGAGKGLGLGVDHTCQEHGHNKGRHGINGQVMGTENKWHRPRDTDIHGLSHTLFEREEGREASLPSQFTRLGVENYPIKGSPYFSG